MAMNKLTDDDLNLVNGGTNVDMESNNDKKEIKCPICGSPAKKNIFSGGRLVCSEGHRFSETDLVSKDYSGGKLNRDIIA